MNSTFTYRKYRLFFTLTLLVLLASACNSESGDQPEVDVEAIPVDTISVAEEEQKEKPKPVVKYHIDSISTAADVDSFQTRYSEEEKKTIFALNRMDPWRLAAGQELIIPDSIHPDIMVYSPFPEKLAFLDSIPKTVLIAQRIQGIALYENGNLIRWGPISSGKQSTPTPNGLHYGNHKAERKVSTVNPDWILPYYFNFMNFEGVGVHQYSMPGYPASHACVRLLKEDARFIYDWAEQWQLDEKGQVIIRNGTPFMVFGEYDFESPLPPWLRLAADPKDNFLNQAELDTLKAYSRRYFEDERNFEKEPEEENQKELSV